MKSIHKLAAMVVLFSVVGVSSAMASTTKSVVVTNNTSYTMTQFYASSSDASSWDTTNNLFAGQSLAPGQQATIDVSSAGGDDCNVDLMAVLYGATQAAYTYSVNACGGGSWSISGM
jgi:hypothetical protein